MRRSCLTILLFFMSPVVRAEGTPSCQTIQTYKDVIVCALENHPDVIRATNADKQGAMLDGIARQRPNPEFVGKSIYGGGSGENVSTTDVDLLHTFELGGKRDSRIRQAESEKQLLSIDVDRTKAEVFSQTQSNLYRLRQLKDESAILDESLSTFSRILKFFKARPTLSPEQEASYGVFQLAEGDAELKKAGLTSQIREIERKLSLAIGKTFVAKSEFLPPPREAWPKIANDGSDRQIASGADMKSALASLKLAQADLENAKSLAWPDLKLGPSFEKQTQGGLSTNAFGLQLSLPLPLYQTNSAGRSYARIGVEKAQRETEIRKSALEAEREILFNRYNDSLAALNRALNIRDLEKKHKNLEGLFNRGLISSQLVIESHRQLLDFVKTRNEHELIATEALARIRAIDGANLLENL